jgi:general secretion pathway protein J
MLVSLAILAMMGTMLLRGLHTVSGFTSRAHAEFNADDGIIAAQRLLRDRIEQLRAVINPNSAMAIVDANGDENSFTFVAPPLARSEPDSLWRYRITTTSTGDLLLFTANSLDDRYNFATRDVQGWRPITILKQVQTIRISYYGERLTGDGSAWQVIWLQRPQPPALVRIRVTFKPGDRRIWPDLIIRPRASENTACKIDLLSGRCGASF